jgi:hypothetical protein
MVRLEPRPPTGAPLSLRRNSESGLRRARSEPASRAEEGSRPRATLGPAAHGEFGRKLSAPGTAQEIEMAFAIVRAMALGIHAHWTGEAGVIFPHGSISFRRGSRRPLPHRG